AGPLPLNPPRGSGAFRGGTAIPGTWGPAPSGRMGFWGSPDLALKCTLLYTTSSWTRTSRSAFLFLQGATSGEEIGHEFRLGGRAPGFGELDGGGDADGQFGGREAQSTCGQDSE